jgi:hypothetical protein
LVKVTDRFDPPISLTVGWLWRRRLSPVGFAERSRDRRLLELSPDAAIALDLASVEVSGGVRSPLTRSHRHAA